MVACAVLHAVVVGAVGVAPAGAERGSSAPVEAKNPARWDPRVRELVRFVERERELEFDHPIDVTFLDDAAFVEALEVDLTAEDRKFDRLYADDLHALGLVGPSFDLTGTVEELDAFGVSGFYDEEKQEMVVRGEHLDDVIVRATVVHELVHALQDQVFGFAAMREQAKTSGADFAVAALIEGDATWVEESYVATLPARDQDEYYAQLDVPTETGAGSPTPSPAIDLLLSTPYTLGFSMVDYLRFTGGSAAVDRAFRNPPPADEHVVDPVALIDRERPNAPHKPKLQEGEGRRGGADEIGVVHLYFTLASRLDPRVALAAATGWDGDTYIGYSRAEVPCIRAAIRTDDADEARELVKALEQWAEAGRPAGLSPGAAPAITVTREGSLVHLDACGVADAPLPTEEMLLDASDALSTRFLVYEGIEDVSPGLTPDELRCFVDLQVTDAEIRDLLFEPELTPAEQRLFDRRSDELASRCGLVPAD